MGQSVERASRRQARAVHPVEATARSGSFAYGGFFLVYYIAVALFVEPRVQYLGRPAAFYFDQRFFEKFLIRPGGLIEYLASGLHQGYQFNWLGAAITTALAGLFVLGAWLLLQKIGRGPVRTLCLWPALGLLLGQRQYSFPWLDVSLALLGALWLAVGYVWLPLKNPSLRWVVFMVISLPGYAVLAGAYLAFALYCGLVEALAGRRYRLTLAVWAAAALLPYGGAWYFSIHVSDACLLLLPFGLGHSSTVMAALPYAALLLAAFARTGQHLLYCVPEARTKGEARSRFGWRRSVEPALLALMAASAAVLGWNMNTQRLARINCLSHDRQWNRVLQEAQLLSAYNPAAISHINRALCQTGRLPYDMFAYPQKESYDFWLSVHKTLDARQCMVASDILFELGQLNRAERMAGEALELNGYLPEVLQRLANVNVLKDEPKAARIFLNILAKTPFHRAWAERRKRELEADPRLARDPELQQVRSFLLTEDHPFGMTTEPILLQCLHQNRTNRMAFEYLMAHYLLTRDLDSFVHYLRAAKVFNYPEIPLHYEEALLLAQKLKETPLAIPDIKGKTVRAETIQRFERFNGQLAAYGDLEHAKTGMLREFGNAYWYYYVFGASGAALTQTDLFTPKP
jgi:Family of unknown function (DUF6057)